jgi:hypothetical protein
LHFLLHAGMRDHEPARVEPQMAHQPVEEGTSFVAEGLSRSFRQGIKLLQSLSKAVRDLHVLARQFTHEFHIVVAGDRECASGRYHIHDESQHSRRIRAAIDQIADEDGAALVRMSVRKAALPLSYGIAKPNEQSLELFAAAMDVADDVKRSAIRTSVAPQRFTHDRCCRDIFLGAQHVDPAEALAIEAPQRFSQAPDMVVHDLAREVSILAVPVARKADIFGQVEHNGHRQCVIAPCQLDQFLAVLRTDIGGVDDGKPAPRQTLGSDGMDEVECVRRCTLVGLVVGNERTASIGRDGLGRQEMAGGECRFAGPRRSHQHHE